MTKNRINDLGKDPIGSLLLRLALPTTAAQLVNALYNLIDRVFIGHIGIDSELALTGVGLCFPITMFISALAVLAGFGGSIRAAIAMGEGKKDGAEELMGGSVSLLLVFSAVSMAVFMIWMEPMLLAFGATENTIGYAADYLSVYLWGTVAALFSVGLNPFISMQGFSVWSMLTTLIGAALNVALDPIFIYVFGWGVRGAAAATVISQCVCSAWVLRFLTGGRTKLRLRRQFLRVRPAVAASIVSLGVSPFIMNATESLVSIAFNTSLRRYGGDFAVGAYTISSSVRQFLWLPVMGLGLGAQPILSFNYGAGSMERVRKLYRLLARCCAVYALGVWAFAELCPRFLVGLFSDGAGLAELAVTALRINMFGLCVHWIQVSCQQTFMALGQSRTSLFFVLLRKLGLLIPLIYILPGFFADKVSAVLMAEPAAGVLSAAACGLTFLYRFPRILNKRKEALEAENAAAQEVTP